MPLRALSRPLSRYHRPPISPLSPLPRYASTTRNPTPNQFAKNASAAYAKQQQPQYQPKPYESTAAQKQTPQQAQPVRRRQRQDIGAGTQTKQPSGNTSLIYRALTSLSSTFRQSAVPSTPPPDTSGTYSVHSPRAAREKVRLDAAAVYDHASVRQKLGYDAVARRVLLAMVAMPIVVVTSWVLFQRLFRGDEKKVFPLKPVSKAKGEDGVGGGGSGSRESARKRMGDGLHGDGQEIGEAVGKWVGDERGGV